MIKKYWDKSNTQIAIIYPTINTIEALDMIVKLYNIVCNLEAALFGISVHFCTLKIDLRGMTTVRRLLMITQTYSTSAYIEYSNNSYIWTRVRETNQTTYKASIK